MINCNRCSSPRTHRWSAVFVPILLVSLALHWRENEAFRSMRVVSCSAFIDLKHDDLDLLSLTEPLLFKNCTEADPHFNHIFGVLSNKSSLQARYGSLQMNVFPSGPFHLQLGSTLVPLDPIGATTLRAALNRLDDGTFAFGTTRDNPGYPIAHDVVGVVANLRRRNNALHANSTSIFLDYFRKFNSHIFSMGGLHSGAPFHFHQSAWLYLCAGQKEWIAAPYLHVLPQDLVWMSLAKIKARHDFRDIFSSDNVIHAVQQPGDLVLLPSFWHHATLNLADYTVGLGGQQHPGLNNNDPDDMVDYRVAQEAGDWVTSAAVEKRAMELHPADMGAALRFILMSLRSLDVDSARQTYYQLREKVLAAFTDGVLTENDVMFLLVDQLGVCVQDALAHVAKRDKEANGGVLPPQATDDFLRIMALREEVQSIVLPAVQPRNWSLRIQGGVDKLLGPLCYDVANFVATNSGYNCTTYAHNRALCFQKAECSVLTAGGPKHCDTNKGMKHTEACCVCAGGRDFRSPEQVGRANARRPLAAGVTKSVLDGGDGTAIYMQLRSPSNKRS
jgi:hypothetical protein